MKKKIINSLILTVLCFLFSCTQQAGYEKVKNWMTPNGKVKVLSTIEVIGDIVKQVGGEHVETLTLVSGELDPHTYQLVKGDDEKLAFADMIFYNGLGLEHGPSLRNFLAESPKAVGLGDLVMKEHPSLILHYNGTLDPHIWMDIELWSRIIPFIVDSLAEKDPSHASDYKQNGATLLNSLAALHQQLKEEMGRVPPEKRFLVTSHDAFNYFARSYLALDSEVKSGEWQKRFAAPEGLAPESQLSTTDIRLILDHMKKYKIHAIFPESNVSQNSIRKLQSAGNEEGINIRIVPEHLYGDAMGPEGSPGGTYQGMISHNVKTIATYLKDYGQYAQ